MKYNWKNDLGIMHTLVPFIVEAQKKGMNIDYDSQEVDIILTVNGVEIDVFSILDRWSNQFHESVNRRAQNYVQDLFGTLMGSIYDKVHLIEQIMDDLILAKSKEAQEEKDLGIWETLPPDLAEFMKSIEVGSDD